MTAIPQRRETETLVVRFAGDSGDGIQVTGERFGLTSATSGHGLMSFPDFPAEIRAPVGTTFGVSAYQIHFGSRRIRTAGDRADMLVAFNPAALRVGLPCLRRGGVVVVDGDSMTARNLQKAGYAADPLHDGSLDGFRVHVVPVTSQVLEATRPHGLGKKDAQRCKNFWALGLVYWLVGYDPEPTALWLGRKFATRPVLAEANRAALAAGYAFGETAELGFEPVVVPRAPAEPGLYRTVTGSEAMAFGIAAAAQLSGGQVFFASYPITPASPILHLLARLGDGPVRVFQAEDEIAAACAAIGASYAGAIGVTSSSGPGIALKMEAIGLAVSAELPLVVINTQRAGPSTGMPTKTEQADLLQAVCGRNGEAPVAVLAPCSPSDCFATVIEAVRLATRHMMPVFVLSDGAIANAAEPWRIPEISALPPIPLRHAVDPDGFHPLRRDPATLARDWAIPGTAGLEHRIGGLEKDHDSGHISYDPANHARMTELRRRKLDVIAEAAGDVHPDEGPDRGRLLLVGWGSTCGALGAATAELRAAGHAVSHLNLRRLWPLPRNIGPLLRGFDQVLVAEMNGGQLAMLLRAECLVDAQVLAKVTGQPFSVAEIVAAAHERLEQAR